ncbi:MAG: hypothetical protein LQ338_005028 [Usnochroma carphineum]|nr:MAG: hypothetical protein LQ338_005028 [Usnochroma carphineum]
MKQQAQDVAEPFRLPDLLFPKPQRPLVFNVTAPDYERPTTYGIPGTGTSGSPRITLTLDWHLTKFQQRETNFLILRALDRLVQTSIRMRAGDGPILDGIAVFRSVSLKITARDQVLRGGFTYSVLATALRGLGELMNDWGATGVDANVYVAGKRVGTIDFDFLL